MDTRLRQQVNFILEADKLKTIIRRNFLKDDSRKENTAEHSWHTVLVAQLFFEYAENKNELDLLHILKMISVHDMVEIYAGDTFIFDEKGYKDKYSRENQGAKKLFTLLPYDQGKEYYDLWLEFEKEETPNAIYASSIDKLMPVLLNTYSKGTSWKEGEITVQQVLEKLRIMEKAPKKIYDLFTEIVDIAKEKGNLKI